MKQTTLFETPPRPGKALARKRGPETSKLAADAIAPKLGPLQRADLKLVIANPGSTQAELAMIEYEDLESRGAATSYYDSRRIGRRLPELEALGLVKRLPAQECSVTRRPAHEWAPTEKGKAAR